MNSPCVLPSRNKWRTRFPGKGNGFTLVEVVAVIVITSILAGVAVQSFQHIETTQLGIATREVKRDLSYVRQRAIARGAATWIVFDIDDNSYMLFEEDVSNPGFEYRMKIEDPISGLPYTRRFGVGDFKSVKLTLADFDGTEVIGFDWLGRSIAKDNSILASNGIMQLNGTHQIQVEANTGHIRQTAP